MAYKCEGNRLLSLGESVGEGLVNGLNSKGSDNMTKQIATQVHVIADRSLGGIKREYVETKNNRGGVVSLEPTDNVFIDGTRHKLVDRKAGVGERILVIEDWYEVIVGSVLCAVDSEIYGIPVEDGDTAYDHIDNSDGCVKYIESNKYRVLEPVDTSPTSEEINNYSPQDVTDLIANLARRVAELERANEAQRKLNGAHSERLAELSQRISGAKDDIEIWAREIEELKHVVAEAKKPTQITFDADVFARMLGGVARD